MKPRQSSTSTPKHTAGHDHTCTGLMTPDTIHQQGLKPGNASPSSNNLNSTLVYSGTNMMPTINESNLSLRLCAARQRMGHHCPRGTSCMMIHDTDITKWPDATFAKWVALIDKTTALDWNRKVVDHAKVSACSAKLSTSSLTIVSANKAKV
jgi:hypothetical protein